MSEGNKSFFVRNVKLVMSKVNNTEMSGKSLKLIDLIDAIGRISNVRW